MTNLELIDETLQQVINDYILPPGAEALIPLNLRRLPSYIGGTILSQDLSKTTDIVSKPLHNLQVCKNYVLTSHNATHAVRRGAEVFVDTTKVNLMCESVPIAGPALAGQHASECAQKYTDKIIIDYKLVDSVKQKALRSKWTKKFGDDFVQSVTSHRPVPTVPTTADVMGNLTVTGLKSTNFSSASNNSRPIWARKFRGGHIEEISTVSTAKLTSSVSKSSQIKVFLIVLLASYGIFVFIKNRPALKKPMVQFIPVQ